MPKRRNDAKICSRRHSKTTNLFVGEGKQHEAVVPLPDNKSIPVDLGKNTGNQNNTNITVNMADGSSEMTTDGGAELQKQLMQQYKPL